MLLELFAVIIIDSVVIIQLRNYISLFREENVFLLSGHHIISFIHHWIIQNIFFYILKFNFMGISYSSHLVNPTQYLSNLQLAL